MTDAPRNKILWHSNAPHSPTGYGNQTRVFMPLIKAHYELVISAFYGIQGARLHMDGVDILPVDGHQYGNDVIEGHFHSTKSDLIISLLDPIVLNPNIWGQLPWCAWTPIDSAPAAPGYINAIQAARWVWSMSQFGHQQMLDAGLKNVEYVPHGIDTEAFKPVDRRQAKEYLGKICKTDLTNKFVLVCVAANKGMPSRKNFHGMFEAFAQFAKTHDDAVLYIHTESSGLMGENLHLLSKFWGIEDKVYFPPNYLYLQNLYQESDLNNIYNAADAFVLLSYGEGFGIPIVEAQAAGTPVILTDGTAMSELCFSGEKVAAIPMQAMDAYRYPAMWFKAMPPYAIQAMEKAYTERHNEQKRKDARTGALAYDYRAVFEMYMKPAINKMLLELKPQPVDLKAKRKRRKASKSANGKVKAQEKVTA